LCEASFEDVEEVAEALVAAASGDFAEESGKGAVLAANLLGELEGGEAESENDGIRHTS
jgi:hypothetical protein